VRRVLGERRESAASGLPAGAADDVGSSVAARAREMWRVRPVPVINATGVILHTNLGRAPLSEEALAAVRQAAAYSDLEYELETGSRGTRQSVTRDLLQTLTGAEAAHVAVNNAAAVTLALAALAKGKEVIVSRGQAVEIGGGFRVPVILRQSGARLVEVGTTNRTRLADYEQAMTGRTGAILHVHSSNFHITGFTETVPLADLARLAGRRGIPLIDDNGSGSLLDTAAFGLGHEPTPVESLLAGSDLVAFSGDKLLGGPQCGIIVGREHLIRVIARHPLARAVRPDKVILAALSATLLAYVRGEAAQAIPVWQMIGQGPSQLEERAAGWKGRAAQRGLAVEVLPGDSTVGGGSLPGETLPTTLIRLPPAITAAKLRRGSPAVIGRTQDRSVLLDLRTVPLDREEALLAAVCAAWEGEGGRSRAAGQ